MRRTKKVKRVLDAIGELRDVVNQTRRQQVLRRDEPRWNQLCSAMDVIGDTSMAVQSHASQKDTRDKGQLYLRTYGVLQALKMRQDAVLDLCRALGSSRGQGDFPGLEEVRNARVSVAGHPTRKQRDKRTGPHFLIQMSLRRDSFEVMSFSANGPRITHISVKDLVEKQEAELGSILRAVIRDFREADAKHKARFLGNKLESVFPNTLGYSFEKIYEHIRRGHCAGLGVWGLDEVQRTLDEYRHGLEIRGIQIDTYDSIKYFYELLVYPLGQLASYLRGEKSDVRNAEAAEIFTYFVEKHLEELRAIARDIDEDFNSNVPE